MKGARLRKSWFTGVMGDPVSFLHLTIIHLVYGFSRFAKQRNRISDGEIIFAL